MSLETGVIRNFAIFTRKHLTACNFTSTSSQKRLQQGDSCKNCDIFTNSYLYGTPPMAAFVRLIK